MQLGKLLGYEELMKEGVLYQLQGITYDETQYKPKPFISAYHLYQQASWVSYRKNCPVLVDQSLFPAHMRIPNKKNTFIINESVYNNEPPITQINDDPELIAQLDMSRKKDLEALYKELTTAMHQAEQASESKPTITEQTAQRGKVSSLLLFGILGVAEEQQTCSREIQFQVDQFKGSEVIMNEIQGLASLTMFAGHIVCFESTSGFCAPDKCYPIAGKMFAYIGKDIHRYEGGEKGFTFSILHKSTSDCVTDLGLTNTGLKNISLKAAIATPNQINFIREAVTSGNAQFASGDSSLTEILKTGSVLNPWR